MAHLVLLKKSMSPDLLNQICEEDLFAHKSETLSIPDNLAGIRLDKALSILFPCYSRNRIKKWIKEGRILFDDCLADPDQKATEGTKVELRPEQDPVDRSFFPEDIDFNVIYENSNILVINKQPGLVIHPAPGNWHGTLLNGLLHRYPETAPQLPRAGIIHRLDKDTSGLLVVARTLTAQTNLIRQMQNRLIKRRYLAFVWGIPPMQGIIDAPIGREKNHRCRMATLPLGNGRPARTHFRLLGKGNWQGEPISLLCCDLETGRTHQIRVHLESIGYPLVGDPIYSRRHFKKEEHLRTATPETIPSFSPKQNKIGNFFHQKEITQIKKTQQKINISRQALHAWQLGLNNPASSEWLEWQVPLPEDMQLLAQTLSISLP